MSHSVSIEQDWGAPDPTSRLSFRPVLPGDYPYLYSLAVMHEGAYRWRFRDVRPSYEDFVRNINNSVLAQFLIIAKDSQSIAGLVVAYQADFRNRHVSVAMQGAPAVRHRGWLLEAGWQFIDWLFRAFGFEKLYAEAPEFTFDSFRSGLGDIFAEEGCLRNHEFAGGRWWDLHILAIHHDNWLRRAGRTKPGRTIDSPSTGSALGFDEFLRHLESHLDLSLEKCSESTLLVEDLGLDSIAHMELLLILEDLGAQLPDSVLQSLLTLGDAHYSYLQYQVTR